MIIVEGPDNVGRFRGRKVAASLKHALHEYRKRRYGKIPRPKGRGLIEAWSIADNKHSGFSIPRPKGRGLIEASASGCVAVSERSDSAAERSRPH